MIGIIDYGMGNLQSVQNALEHLGLPNAIVARPGELDRCSKLILPGVGAFGQAMERLDALGFSSAIRGWVSSGKPLLGICLGMQLLFESSSELGEHEGLGLMRGSVRPLREKVRGLPVPHIGWNDTSKVKADSRLLAGLGETAAHYYVHSYYCDPADRRLVAAESDYGGAFASVVEDGALFGCQFHPEKSQAAGLLVLKNFGNPC